ncbi:MAG: PEP-CTERM sorting domain-containing protein [Deltaproteobacteria bacterium]|nr:PEP-CTERM sorting domain-containing protein [Deltaproteobacteria bacterium]
MTIKSKLSRIIVGAVAILLCASYSHADLVLRLDDPAVGVGFDVVIVDNVGGTHPDSNPVLGAVTFIGTVGVWVVNVTTALSKPLPPNSPSVAHIDLNSVNTSTGAGTLIIQNTDENFQLVPFGINFRSNIGGTLAPGSLTYQEWMDFANVHFGMGGPTPGQLGPFAGPGAFSSTLTTVVPYGGQLFSLTEEVTLVHTAAGTSSFDAESHLEAVPEPASLLLLGSGLMGLSFLGRRKWAKGGKK